MELDLYLGLLVKSHMKTSVFVQMYVVIKQFKEKKKGDLYDPSRFLLLCRELHWKLCMQRTNGIKSTQLFSEYNPDSLLWRKPSIPLPQRMQDSKLVLSSDSRRHKQSNATITSTGRNLAPGFGSLSRSFVLFNHLPISADTMTEPGLAHLGYFQ